jgi:hypothetical protein
VTSRATPNTSDTLNHPAARAWATLGAWARPPHRIDKLTTLRGRPIWKSTCYRLVGAGPEGDSIVAKRAPTSSLRTEHIIHSDILSRLPIRTLRFYGYVESHGDASSWLFLEDAGGIEYDDTRASHRNLAAQWLGTVHAATSVLGLDGVLPDRGPHYYLKKLAVARCRLLESRRDDRMKQEQCLPALASRFDALQRAWGRIDMFCRALSKTLVHGDFTAKNVRVRQDGDAEVLFVMDWDVAGWAVPASDLAALDLAAYASLQTQSPLPTDQHTLSALAGIGRIFRLILWIEATSSALTSEWIERPLAKLRTYEELVARETTVLGWT